MIVYILIGALIAIWGALLYREEKPGRGLFPIFLVLTLLAGLRGDMATDHKTYTNFFDRMANSDWQTVFTGEYTMERGFAVLCKLISIVADSHVLYMLVIAIITIGLYTLSYKKSAKIPWLAMVMFFAIGDYFDSFNIVRNVLAAAICFFAITTYASGEKKSFWKYLLLVLLASMLHTSALVMIPMYFVLKIRFTLKTLVTYAGIGAASFVLLTRIASKFMEWFSRYEIYDQEKYDKYVVNINAVIPTIGVFLFVIICIYFFKADIDLNEDNNRIAMHGLTLTLMFMILATQMYLAYRFAHFFKPFVAIAAVNTIASLKSSKNKSIIIGAVSLVAVIAVWIFYRESPYDPYRLHSEILEFFR